MWSFQFDLFCILNKAFFLEVYQFFQCGTNTKSIKAKKIHRAASTIEILNTTISSKGRILLFWCTSGPVSRYSRNSVSKFGIKLRKHNITTSLFESSQFGLFYLLDKIFSEGGYFRFALTLNPSQLPQKIHIQLTVTLKHSTLRHQVIAYYFFFILLL